MRNEELPGKEDLRILFNRISWADQKKLRAAALVNAVTGAIRDDTKQHPWKFPFYVGYLALLMEPVPTGGIILGATIAATYGATRLPTQWSRWLRSRMEEAQKDDSLMETYSQFIVPDEQKPGHWRIDLAALTKFTGAQGFNDSVDAGKSAMKGAHGGIRAAWDYAQAPDGAMQSTLRKGQEGIQAARNYAQNPEGAVQTTWRKGRDGALALLKKII